MAVPSPNLAGKSSSLEYSCLLAALILFIIMVKTISRLTEMKTEYINVDIIRMLSYSPR